MTARCGHPTADDSPCQNPATEGDNCWIPAHGGSADDHGRPSKLTKTVVDEITTNIAEGKSDNAAFRLAGLHPSTKGNWLGKVDPDEVADDPDFDADPYGYFFRRYTHARGLGEDFYFTNVIEMAMEQGDHRFVATLMKQRYGDSWGETETGVDSDSTVIQVPENVAEVWQRAPSE